MKWNESALIKSTFRKPTKSRLILTHHVNRSGHRWSKCLWNWSGRKGKGLWRKGFAEEPSLEFRMKYWIIIIIIINKVLIKVTLNKVITGALYIVCGWNTVKVQGWQLTVKWCKWWQWRLWRWWTLSYYVISCCEYCYCHVRGHNRKFILGNVLLPSVVTISFLSFSCLFLPHFLSFPLVSKCPLNSG